MNRPLTKKELENLKYSLSEITSSQTHLIPLGFGIDSNLHGSTFTGVGLSFSFLQDSSIKWSKAVPESLNAHTLAGSMPDIFYFSCAESNPPINKKFYLPDGLLTNDTLTSRTIKL